jgi:hypothetical protein
LVRTIPEELGYLVACACLIKVAQKNGLDAALEKLQEYLTEMLSGVLHGE